MARNGALFRGREEQKCGRNLRWYSELAHASSDRCPHAVSSLRQKGSKGSMGLVRKRKPSFYMALIILKQVKGMRISILSLLGCDFLIYCRLSSAFYLKKCGIWEAADVTPCVISVM